MEKDDELKGAGNGYTTEFRLLDPRLGRWFTKDPIAKSWESRYATCFNNPIVFVDPRGLDGEEGDDPKPPSAPSEPKTGSGGRPPMPSDKAQNNENGNDNCVSCKDTHPGKYRISSQEFDRIKSKRVAGHQYRRVSDSAPRYRKDNEGNLWKQYYVTNDDGDQLTNGYYVEVMALQEPVFEWSYREDACTDIIPEVPAVTRDVPGNSTSPDWSLRDGMGNPLFPSAGPAFRTTWDNNWGEDKRGGTMVNLEIAYDMFTNPNVPANAINKSIEMLVRERDAATERLILNYVSRYTGLPTQIKSTPGQAEMWAMRVHYIIRIVLQQGTPSTTFDSVESVWTKKQVGTQYNFE